MSDNSNLKVRVSQDDGETWVDFVEAVEPTPEPTDTPTPTPEPTDTPTPEPPTTNGEPKGFLATFLSYVNPAAQSEAYKPLTDHDYVRVRQESGNLTGTEYSSLFKPATMTEVNKVHGIKGADFKTAKQLIAIAPRLPKEGFSFCELNIESGAGFDGSEYNNLMANYKKAADAAHAAGLKFKAAPMYADLRTNCVELSKFCDALHVQTQAVQAQGPDVFKKRLTDIMDKVNAGNPAAKGKIYYTCQLSTGQGNMTGKTLLQTFQECTKAVMGVPGLRAVTLWFGGDDVTLGKDSILKQFVNWFKQTYP